MELTCSPVLPLLPILILAQAEMLPSGNPAPSHHSGAHGHPRHPAATPTPSPQVRITVVNATCAPALSLGISGTNLPVAYPFFPQGEWTGNAPLQTPEIRYVARTTNGVLLADRVIRFKPVSSQILMLTGDLSTNGPADQLPRIGSSPQPATRASPPNLQFHLYSLEASCKDLCRYRVVNAMPSRLLLLRTVAGGGKPSRQIALLPPGSSALLTHQPASVEWEAVIEEQVYNVAIRQTSNPRNCLVPFFLRNGKPDYIRVFENP